MKQVRDNNETDNNKSLSLKKIIIFALVTFGATLLTLSGVTELVLILVNDDNILQQISLFDRLYVFCSIAVILALIQVIVMVYNQYNSLYTAVLKSEKEQLNENNDVVSIIEQSYKSERWNEVVKICRPLSEPLWYAGKFDLRKKLGLLLAQAAGLCQEFYIQAETYLDDLGWTNYRQNNIDAAKMYIKQGLHIAEEHKLYYLIAKGNRHYCDIMTQHNDFERAKSYFDIAWKNTDNIEDENKKIEMKGNLLYTKAKLLYAQKQYSDAIKSVDESITHYKKICDKDREVKLYNLKGRIILDQTHNYDEAIEVFQKGYELAFSISNNVHIVSNSLSLSECYAELNNFSMAERMIEIAVKYIPLMNDPNLVEKIEKIRAKIKLRQIKI